MFYWPSDCAKLVSILEMPSKEEAQDGIEGNDMPNRVLPSDHCRLEGSFKVFIDSKKVRDMVGEEKEEMAQISSKSAPNNAQRG